MDTRNVFDWLILGLRELFDRPDGIVYPLPQSLLRATQALFQTGQLPPTLRQMLRQWSRPVRDWWPQNWYVPTEFDQAFGLIDGNSLSEESFVYYYTVLIEQVSLTKNYPPGQTQHALDNFRFKSLLNKLRQKREEAIETERGIIDALYTQIRRYLIENPFTTQSALRQAFWKSRKLVGIDDIAGLYEECTHDTDQWLCHRCGPLYQLNGKLHGVQPNRCNQHALDSVKQIRWEPGTLRIRPGIHWQVYIPGIPELQLLTALEAIKNAYSRGIHQLILWPALDQYDLRIDFTDGSAWAVDVKDHHDPIRLAQTLTPIPDAGNLAYRAGFYVVPDERTQRNPSYMTLVREKSQLPDSIAILTHQQFIERVAQQAYALSKKRRKA